MSSPAELVELRKIFNDQGDSPRVQVMSDDLKRRINAARSPEELVIEAEERKEQQKPK